MFDLILCEIILLLELVKEIFWVFAIELFVVLCWCSFALKNIEEFFVFFLIERMTLKLLLFRFYQSFLCLDRLLDRNRFDINWICGGRLSVYRDRFQNKLVVTAGLTRNFIYFLKLSFFQNLLRFILHLIHDLDKFLITATVELHLNWLSLLTKFAT